MHPSAPPLLARTQVLFHHRFSDTGRRESQSRKQIALWEPIFPTLARRAPRSGPLGASRGKLEILGPWVRFALLISISPSFKALSSVMYNMWHVFRTFTDEIFCESYVLQWFPLQYRFPQPEPLGYYSVTTPEERTLPLSGIKKKKNQLLYAKLFIKITLSLYQ